MTITIRAGYDDSYVFLTCKRREFTEVWGPYVRTTTSLLYKNMQEIATWANNELGESCLFEVE